MTTEFVPPDLWSIASEDEAAKDHEAKLSAARVAAAEITAALMRADDLAAYGNRKALYGDRLDSICQRIAHNDPTEQAVLRSDLEASLDADFALTHEAADTGQPGANTGRSPGKYLLRVYDKGKHDPKYNTYSEYTETEHDSPEAARPHIEEAEKKGYDWRGTRKRESAKEAGPYGRGSMYADDPHWLNQTKYAGQCSKCGTVIPRGARAWYWPNSAKRKRNPLECEKCGSDSEARFEGERWDEDQMSRGLASLHTAVDLTTQFDTREAAEAAIEDFKKGRKFHSGAEVHVMESGNGKFQLAIKNAMPPILPGTKSSLEACCEHCAGFEAGLYAHAHGYLGALSALASESAEYRRGFDDAMDAISQTGSFRKGAPFADYKDFADCVSKNRDKNNPEAYCGKIKHQVEDTKTSAHSDTCPKCGAHMDKVTVTGDKLSAECHNCGWKGTKRKSSLHEAVSGTPCHHCGKPVFADDPAYDPDWGLIQIHDECFKPYTEAQEARAAKEWADMWDRNPYMHEAWGEQGLSREKHRASRTTGASDSIYCKRCDGTGMIRAGGVVRNCPKCKGTGVDTKTRKMINKDLGEDFLGDQPKRGASESMPMRCGECDKTFKKKIGPNTVEVKCPRCGGYDTEPDYEHPESHKWLGSKTAVSEEWLRERMVNDADLAPLEAEWDAAFAALRAAGLEADADHPIAARYRAASDAVNHAHRSRDWAIMRGESTASRRTADGKPPWLDKDNDAAKGKAPNSAADADAANANAEPNEDDEPAQDTADTQSHLDPSQMQAGQPLTVTYTLTGNASGSGTAEAQFESFDGTTAYFTYDGGRFAATQGPDGQWQDAAGTTFDFALSGNAQQPPMQPQQPPQQTQPQQPPQPDQGGTGGQEVGTQPQQKLPPKKKTTMLEAVWDASDAEERTALLHHMAQNPYNAPFNDAIPDDPQKQGPFGTGQDANNPYDTANNQFGDNNPMGGGGGDAGSAPVPTVPTSPRSQRPQTTKPRQIPGGGGMPGGGMAAPAAPMQQGFK